MAGVWLSNHFSWYFARRLQIFRLPSDTSGLLPLHPVFTTEHDFVWCLPPAPYWWEQAMRRVRWTLYHAATEAANQGGSELIQQ